MPRFVLATSNQGKLREITEILEGSSLEVVPQSAYAVPDVEETGASFVENALIKARNASLSAGLPAIADDSGLVVDALGGAPGIHSARYAGARATDRGNLEKLLEAVSAVPQGGRQARFYCLMTFLRHPEDPAPLICQGVWEGTIISEPRGENGFGYDPIFLVAGSECTAAELDSKTKNRLSHRGQAMELLAAQLKSECRRL